MYEFRITQGAKEGLIDIAQYGDKKVGVAQSDRYRDQLKQRFFILAEQPLHYPSVNHIRKGRRPYMSIHLEAFENLENLPGKYLQEIIKQNILTSTKTTFYKIHT